MSEWKTWIPQYDGHAPDDWCPFEGAKWVKGVIYSYPVKHLQDATYEPDLLAQCLALPQDQREALIEAMQKPQRDWADDVADQLCCIVNGDWSERAAAVIRSMCRPKEELQHVAYYSDGEFYWMSGIAPRDCELFAKRKDCA